MIRRRAFLKSASSLPFVLMTSSITAIPVRKLPQPDRVPDAVKAYQWPRRPLTQPIFEHSMACRYQKKAVTASRTIDDMERNLPWHMDGPGLLEYTTDRAKSGRRSMRLTMQARDEAWIQSHRRPDGSFEGGLFGGFTSVNLQFAAAQDWSTFNRISLWVYVHPSDAPNFQLMIRFVDRGDYSGYPLSLDRTHWQHALKAGEWNHVVWEIPELKRDEVVSFSICHFVRGILPGMDREVVYDIDDIQLQHVQVEPYAGWSVPAGKIALNHVGYLPLDQKRAILSGLTAATFDVLSADGKHKIASLPVRHERTAKGDFALLDFSSVQAPGRYILRAGDSSTQPFEISDRLWSGPLEKNFNYWYAVRCGIDVPGVHFAAHYDVTATYDGVTKVINGGWYDAGDTFQMTSRTHDILLGMLALYEQMDGKLPTSEFTARVLEELRWGLCWALHVRFGHGIRCAGFQTRFYSDNIRGNADDVTGSVSFDAGENLHFAAVGSAAARILRGSDPLLADRCLAAAREDYDATHPKLPDLASVPRAEVAWGAMAAIELFGLTGESVYARDAKAFGAVLLASQERSFVGGKSITGYFYENGQRKAVAHEAHTSAEEAPLVALSKLCRAFPDDSAWADWYAAGLIYGEYFAKSGAALSAPFFHLPNSVYAEGEADALVRDGMLEQISPDVFAMRKEQVLEQIRGGTLVSTTLRLRTFPVWSRMTGVNSAPVHFRGSTQVQLAATVAVAATAGLRQNSELERLARAQLDWVFGGNPLSQSMMFGEGYDFQSHWVGCFTEIVGSLPVGIDARADDTPYYPAANTPTFKEQWGLCSGKFLWAMSYLALPARVTGYAKERTIFRDTAGRITDVPSGVYAVNLPAGRYEVRCGSLVRSISLIGGTNRSLDLDPANAIMIVAQHELQGRKVNFTLQCTGAGAHVIDLRASNINLEKFQSGIDFSSNISQIVKISGELKNVDMPWVLIIIPDDKTEEFVECFGDISDGRWK